MGPFEYTDAGMHRVLLTASWLFGCSPMTVVKIPWYSVLDRLEDEGSRYEEVLALARDRQEILNGESPPHGVDDLCVLSAALTGKVLTRIRMEPGMSTLVRFHTTEDMILVYSDRKTLCQFLWLNVPTDITNNWMRTGDADRTVLGVFPSAVSEEEVWAAAAPSPDRLGAVNVMLGTGFVRLVWGRSGEGPSLSVSASGEPCWPHGYMAPQPPASWTNPSMSVTRVPNSWGTINSMPLPVVHRDFTLTARDLVSTPSMDTLLEDASRRMRQRVMEGVERAAFQRTIDSMPINVSEDLTSNGPPPPATSG